MISVRELLEKQAAEFTSLRRENEGKDELAATKALLELATLHCIARADLARTLEAMLTANRRR